MLYASSGVAEGESPGNVSYAPWAPKTAAGLVISASLVPIQFTQNNLKWRIAAGPFW